MLPRGQVRPEKKCEVLSKQGILNDLSKSSFTGIVRINGKITMGFRINVK